MDYTRIETLLEKYFAAETTVEEEKFLREFFSGQEVPEHLQQYTQLFAYFKLTGEESVGEKTETRIQQIPGSARGKGSVRYFYYTLVSAAAVIALMLLLWKKSFTGSSREIVFDQPSQKQIAYQQSRETLLFVSSKLNMGKKQVSKMTAFSDATSQVKKIK